MHPLDLWDFSDPAASEDRFRAAAADADGPQRAIWLTQVARALGLQEGYDAAHAVLDDIMSAGVPPSPEVATRVLLERGRLHRSAGDPTGARPLFEEAARTALGSDLDELHVDALHMVALVAPAEEQHAILEHALAVATASSDARARDWDASLLNNIGMAYADGGAWEDALSAFEKALAARRRIGDDARTRVARWMVGWALRNLGRSADALALQTALKAELDALGEVDPYVDEELALLSDVGS